MAVESVFRVGTFDFPLEVAKSITRACIKISVVDYPVPLPMLWVGSWSPLSNCTAWFGSLFAYRERSCHMVFVGAAFHATVTGRVTGLRAATDVSCNTHVTVMCCNKA